MIAAINIQDASTPKLTVMIMMPAQMNIVALLRVVNTPPFLAMIKMNVLRTTVTPPLDVVILLFVVMITMPVLRKNVYLSKDVFTKR